MSVEDYDKRMLALPIARKVSGEDEEHTPNDPDYSPIPNSATVRGHDACGCDRCRVIRIKQRKASLFPQTKCVNCGDLFVALLVDAYEPRCKTCQERTSRG